MSSTASPLPIPSCDEAQSLGFTIPELLLELERGVGVAACRAFLIRRGGQKVEIPRTDAAIEKNPDRAAIGWLRDQIGFGRLYVPLGPARHNTRLAWAVLTAWREGASTNQTASRLGLSERTVTRLRARLREGGHDLTPQTYGIER